MLTKPGPVVPAQHGRGMRDSDSRGLTPNTLSKPVGVRSRQVSRACDLELWPGPVLRGRPRTAASETRTETGAAPVPRGFRPELEAPMAPGLLSGCRIGLPAMVCTPTMRLGRPVGQQGAGKLGNGRAEVLPSGLERTCEERMVNVCRWYGDFALRCSRGRHPLLVQIA
jgi:hypothetical protein